MKRCSMAPRRWPARLRRGFIYIGMVLAASGAPAATITDSVTVADGTTIEYRVFNRAGARLVLWLPSETGDNAGERAAAQGLARRNVEVWLADLLNARLLPPVRSSMHAIPAEDVVALLVAAQTRGKPVYIASSGLGAGVALRGAALAQRTHASARLAGAVLWSPNLYVETPEVGSDARYIDAAVALPIAILQPEQSPWYWRLDQLQRHLKNAGSRVDVQRLPGVRDRFYFRGDATAKETALARALPKLIDEAMARLAAPTPAAAPVKP